MKLLKWLLKITKPSRSLKSVKSANRFQSTQEQPDEYQAIWTSYDVPFGPKHRIPGMVGLPEAADISVAGTSHRLSDCAAFIQAAVKTLQRNVPPPKIELKREPGNPADSAAIMVWGVLPTGRWHLGYVPANVAGTIARTWNQTLPIDAELRRFGLHRKDEAVFFAINVIVPVAKERRKYLLEVQN